MSQVNLLVGHNVRKYRKAKGLTQEKLALEAGITSEYISRIENGKENPTVELLFKISTVLGIEVATLFMKE